MPLHPIACAVRVFPDAEPLRVVVSLPSPTFTLARLSQELTAHLSRDGWRVGRGNAFRVWLRAGEDAYELRPVPDAELITSAFALPLSLDVEVVGVTALAPQQ